MSTEGAGRASGCTEVFADDRVAGAVSAAAADAAADLLERSEWDSAKIADTRMDLFVDNSGLRSSRGPDRSAAMTDAKRAELQAVPTARRHL